MSGSLLRAIVIAGLIAGGGVIVACQEVKTVSDAQTAAVKTATAVTAIRSDAPLLTKVQATECAGQAAANALTDYLTMSGKAEAATKAAAVAAALGKGCSWKQPVSGLSP